MPKIGDLRHRRRLHLHVLILILILIALLIVTTRINRYLTAAHHPLLEGPIRLLPNLRILLDVARALAIWEGRRVALWIVDERAVPPDDDALRDRLAAMRQAVKGAQEYVADKRDATEPC